MGGMKLLSVKCEKVNWLHPTLSWLEHPELVMAEFLTDSPKDHLLFSARPGFGLEKIVAQPLDCGPEIPIPLFVEGNIW